MQMAGIQTFLYSAQDLRGGGRCGGSQFQFVLLDQDLAELRTWTARLETALQKVGHGIEDVTSDQDRTAPQANVVIDRDAAARLDVSATAIDNALNNAFAQRQISIIYTQRNQYRVVLETCPALQTDPSPCDHIYVAAPGATQVPLSAGRRISSRHRPARRPPPGPVPRRHRQLQPRPRHPPGRRASRSCNKPPQTCACPTACAPSSPATRNSCRNRSRPSRC